MVGTTADFPRFGPPQPLPVNHLLCEKLSNARSNRRSRAKDEIIPKALVGRLPAECGRHARLAWYRDAYHALMRDLEGPIVIADVANWVLAPAAALPSGADRDAADAFLPAGSQVSLLLH